MFKLNIIKTIKSFDWQSIGLFSIIFLLLLSLYIFRISSFLPGFSLDEKTAINSANSIRSIFDNPLFAPHKLIQYFMIKIGHNGYLAMRLPSILMSTIVIGLFYSILRRWFSIFISVVATLLLATNSLYLGFTRNASTEITILAVFILVAYGLWLKTQPKPSTAIILGMFMSSLILYTPGLIWFYILFLFWQKTAIVHLYHSHKKFLVFTPVLIIVFLLPLFLSIFSSIKTLEVYLGLPDDLVNSLVNLPKNIALIPYQLFYHGLNKPSLNIVGTPVFEVFSIAMFILGSFYYVVNNKSKDLFKVLIGIVLLLCFVALNSSKYIILLVPFITIVIAYGINEMLEKWYVKFPNNPIARGLATTLIVVAVASASFYNINKYYIAWPQTPIIRSTFIYPPLPNRSIDLI